MILENPPILLTPGPVQLEKSVLNAIMGFGHLHHRMPDFQMLLDSSTQNVEEIFQIPEDYEIVFLGCSGTGMVEAMLRNFHALSKGRVLCLINGHFGSRLFNIAQRLGMDPLSVTVEEGHNFELHDLDRILSENPGIGAIAVVHLETSVGHVNDLESLSQYCKGRKIDLLVDMVSSLAGEPLDFATVRPSLAVSVSGKAIGALPGIGIAFVRADIADQLGRSSIQEHYFSFLNYIAAKSRYQATPFTPPVHLFPAFNRALQLILDEGLDKKILRHKMGIRLLERVALSFGFDVQKSQSPSHTTRTFHYNPQSHAEFDNFKAILRDKGFVPLQNPISQRHNGIFQLSSMGYLPLPLLEKLESELITLVKVKCYA